MVQYEEIGGLHAIGGGAEGYNYGYPSCLGRLFMVGLATSLVSFPNPTQPPHTMTQNPKP